jgi:hypothetical protein
LFPIEHDGDVLVCVGVIPDGIVSKFTLQRLHDEGVTSFSKHGLDFVPLNQKIFVKKVRVRNWAAMTGEKFVSVPKEMEENYPEFLTYCLHIEMYHNETQLLKYHKLQPEINTRAGIMMNPQWKGWGHVWTVSLKVDGCEAMRGESLCFSFFCTACDYENVQKTEIKVF